ncbi:PEPxxWA-CTERM sorting domain-containing protein [Phenylobacterium sp.]|uniref:PEPxxWA-CTERM sorting domain-containing protein n=1 Tax=Phenylobacterium sp. TaxID=1871053 RepID=UPI002E30C8FC|nr:PEPxxWA-CTERM sorting domain-containing protein [Phenylobacterium sp.]HEX3367853.1 PEPxxWA-CTERM sorting domain-containing protein [Phenylobacterium sp.]
MKTLLLTASVAALSFAALASGAQAATTVFATTTTLAAGPNFTWTNNGAGDTGSGGTLTGTGSTSFSFENSGPVLNLLAFVPANFNFTATATGAPAGFSGAPNDLWTQTGLSGSFSYTFSGTTGTMFGGTTLTNGENLLSGTFTNAWIQGNGGSGSTNLSVGNGGHMTFTSTVDPALASAINPEFAYTLLAVTPNFGATSSSAALESFTGKGDGEFSFTTAVPEPAAWSLMIMGFGGLGALLRQRRRQAYVAA